MDEDMMADGLAYALNDAPWQAVFLGLGQIKFTNENGDQFRLTVEEWDASWDDKD